MGPHASDKFVMLNSPTFYFALCAALAIAAATISIVVISARVLGLI